MPGGLFVVNAFKPDDSEYAVGKEIVPDTHAYRDTLFRFYREPELRALFDGWEIVKLDQLCWQDPPHGEFRRTSKRTTIGSSMRRHADQAARSQLTSRTIEEQLHDLHRSRRRAG